MKPTNIDYNDDDTEYREEWLSAYLDNELTEEQQLIVEQRLAMDSAAQATLNDLKRIRGLVQQLPAWSGPMAAVPPPTAIPRDGSTEGESPKDGLVKDTPESRERLPARGAVVGPITSSGDQTHSAPGTLRRKHAEPRGGTQRIGWLRPAAIAASLLLIVGVSYGLWRSGDIASTLALETWVEKSASMEAPTSSRSSESEAAADAELLVEGFGLPAAELEAAWLSGEPKSNAEPESTTPFGAARSDSFASDAESIPSALADAALEIPSDASSSLPFQFSNPAPRSAPTLTPGIASAPAQSMAVAPAEGAEPRQELLLGNDARWSAEMIQSELQNNAMLNAWQRDQRGVGLGEQLARRINADNAAPQAADRTAKTGRALAVAQIPTNADPRALFNRLLTDYQLLLLAELAVPAAADEAQPSSLERNKVARAVPSQTLMLFVTRRQAEQILKEHAPQSANNQAPQYMWITPSGGASAAQRNGGIAQRDDEEQVILMLNSPR